MKKELLVNELMNMEEVTTENVFNALLKHFEEDKEVDYIGKKENLKLYDIAYFIGTKLDELDLSYDEYNNIYNLVFNLFCENNYDIFKSIEIENNTERKYIGSTSTFVINSKHYNIFDYYYSSDYSNELNIETKKSMLVEEFIYNWLNVSEDYISEEYKTKEDFIYMAGEFNDFIECIKDIYKTYEYIEDFKEKQLENFKYWYENFYIENYDDVLNAEKDF